MIFRYPGGKSRKAVRAKIMAHFPEHYTEFRDATVGGGGIFFGVPGAKTRWINDLDVDLMSVYRALQDHPAAFIASCRAIPVAKDGEKLAPSRPGGKPLWNARLKKMFDRCVARTKTDEDTGVSTALAWFFIHRTVWAGRVNYDVPCRLYFSNPSGWNVAHSPKMEAVAQALEGVRITAQDYEPCLTEPGKDVLVYLDAPYVVNTEMTPQDKQYRHSFTIADHERMAKLARACKHKVILSYDEHPLIRKLYKGWHIHTEQWLYVGRSSVTTDNQSGIKTHGKELVITNY